MDQLRDAPTDDSVLYSYINWYVWTTFVGSVLIRLPLALSLYNVFSPLFLPIALIFLAKVQVPLVLDWIWFNNPYRLVYRVIKFASEHKNPIRHSAFTYYENELPSRLDLGKEKCGPRTFLNWRGAECEGIWMWALILSALLTIGLNFVADIALNKILVTDINHSPYKLA